MQLVATNGMKTAISQWRMRRLAATFNNGQDIDGWHCGMKGGYGLVWIAGRRIVWTDSFVWLWDRRLHVLFALKVGFLK